jgi:hypothetical protein
MGRGGGGAAELRRDSEGGVDRWLVHHRVEVSGGAWKEVAVLNWAHGGRKGITSGWLGRLGQKVRRKIFWNKIGLLEFC